MHVRRGPSAGGSRQERLDSRQERVTAVTRPGLVPKSCRRTRDWHRRAPIREGAPPADDPASPDVRPQLHEGRPRPAGSFPPAPAAASRTAALQAILRRLLPESSCPPGLYRRASIAAMAASSFLMVES